MCQSSETRTNLRECSEKRTEREQRKAENVIGERRHLPGLGLWNGRAFQEAFCSLVGIGMKKGPCLVPSLQRLAAKTAGKSCRGGRWAAKFLLKRLPYPEALIRIVLPFVVLSRWEWEDFLLEEECLPFPRLDPEGEVFRRLKTFYYKLYGERTYYRDYRCDVVA